MKKSGSKILAAGLGAAAIAVLILWVSGFFVTGKIEPTSPVPPPAAGLEAPAAVTTLAVRETVTEWFEAVGTLRPRTQTNVESQVSGRVVEVLVNTGLEVKTGQTLVILDSREFVARLDQADQGAKSARSRVEQARQAVISAQAELDRAHLEFERYKRLFQSKTVTTRDLEKAKTAFIQAQANLQKAADGRSEAESGVRQVEKQVEEARITSAYTTIKALDSGQVVKRMVDPGDLAVPGKTLLVIQANNALRLEALVREGLIDQIRPGVELRATVDALGQTLVGQVEEVGPSADPQTRTFLVKVAVEPVPGLYAGMFGRLLIPVGRREVVAAPKRAVRRVGQLELVKVKTDQGWRDQFVRTGQDLGDKIEILSGLDGGETLALPANV
ncbi:MAG: efflux RND transporter periplasmic adaptor subunit [Pseudomonadota bacterium]